MVIGIDIGGSTTKIVGYDGENIISPMMVRATDPIASLYGAFGKFLNQNGFDLGEIERVLVTGVGSSFLQSDIFSLPTSKIDEFRAIGAGGLFLSGLGRAIVVSMGTGTALVMAEDGKSQHLGGTGIGGGTLLGLSNVTLNVRKFEDLIEMARGGSLKNVDLTIGDITRSKLKGLNADTTASNLGNISDLASKSDIALGIINLVFQTIGMLAVFAARERGVDVAVLTGTLTNIPQVYDVFSGMHTLSGIDFLIPPNAEFSTAVGAAILGSAEGN